MSKPRFARLIGTTEVGMLSKRASVDMSIAQVQEALLLQDAENLARAIAGLSRKAVFSLAEAGRGRNSAKLLAVLLQRSSKATI